MRSTAPRGVKLVKRELGTTNLGGLAGPEEGTAGAGVTLGALIQLRWLWDMEPKWRNSEREGSFSREETARAQC